MSLTISGGSGLYAGKCKSNAIIPATYTCTHARTTNINIAHSKQANKPTHTPEAKKRCPNMSLTISGGRGLTSGKCTSNAITSGASNSK